MRRFVQQKEMNSSLWLVLAWFVILYSKDNECMSAKECIDNQEEKDRKRQKET
jgi:hypothetical protein